MILEIDAGNSRVKWRQVRADQPPGQVRFLEHAALSELAGELAGVKRIRVSSVVGKTEKALATIVQGSAASLEFAQSSASCAGVQNSYSSPGLMGVDRWLAMLAAFNSSMVQRDRAIAVIDCGTSMTIDFVAANGRHEGGLIMPGRQLLLDSLTRRTDKVLFDPAKRCSTVALACSTEEAVLNGAMNMLTGAVHAVHSRDVDSISRQYFLTGGDAELIAGHLPVKAEVVPDLVLDGLQYALP